MAQLERLTQQAVVAELGAERAAQACVPTCFYMVARAGGWLADGGPDLATFCAALDWVHDFTPAGGWIRPRLSRYLRQRYGWPVVSWQLEGAGRPSLADRAAMQEAGYWETAVEAAFFDERVVGRDVSELVGAGYPVIVGVRPGFGANGQNHAVVLARWDAGEVEVADPDVRNRRRRYTEAEVRSALNPAGGGCSVVLPRIAHG